MPERPGYKRLETDDEYRARVYAFLGNNAVYWRTDLEPRRGEHLDFTIESCFKMQRRIIEVFP